jgi:hypothetical protein
MSSSQALLEQEIDHSRCRGQWITVKDQVSKYKRKYAPNGSGMCERLRESLKANPIRVDQSTSSPHLFLLFIWDKTKALEYVGLAEATLNLHLDSVSSAPFDTEFTDLRHGTTVTDLGNPNKLKASVRPAPIPRSDLAEAETCLNNALKFSQPADFQTVSFIRST